MALHQMDVDSLHMYHHSGLPHHGYHFHHHIQTRSLEYLAHLRSLHLALNSDIHGRHEQYPHYAKVVDSPRVVLKVTLPEIQNKGNQSTGIKTREIHFSLPITKIICITGLSRFGNVIFLCCGWVCAVQGLHIHGLKNNFRTGTVLALHGNFLETSIRLVHYARRDCINS